MRAQRQVPVGQVGWWSLVALMAATLLSVQLQGHHSYSEFYLENDTIEIEGEILEFQYMNPHSWIHVMAQDPFGAAKPYAAEWVSTSRLEREGITKNTLRAGDVVRIWASPNRNPNDNRVRLKRIERRRDRWQWGGQNRRAPER